MYKKMIKNLKSDRAEADYISTVVFVFVAVLILAFVLNLFSIISVKRQLDLAADQMVKQIQLAGGVNGDTDALFAFLSSEITGAQNITYTVDAPNAARIQLGTPFFVTVTGRANLGGMWNFNVSIVTIESRGAGVSEHYWK